MIVEVGKESSETKLRLSKLLKRHVPCDSVLKYEYTFYNSDLNHNPTFFKKGKCGIMYKFF